MKFRGSEGNAALGGVQVGTPLVQGAVAQSATQATIDGAPLTGTILAGDKFTVAGDAQEYTIVAGGRIGSTTPNELAVTFSPAVQAAGGWADNALVTFASNSVANVGEWSAEASRPVIEATVMQSGAQRTDLDVPRWRGRMMVFLDYGDPVQKRLIDQIVDDGTVTPISVTLVVASGKNLWGSLMAADAQVTARSGAYVEASVSFEGEDQLNVDWN